MYNNRPLRHNSEVHSSLLFTKSADQGEFATSDYAFQGPPKDSTSFRIYLIGINSGQLNRSHCSRQWSELHVKLMLGFASMSQSIPRIMSSTKSVSRNVILKLRVTPAWSATTTFNVCWPYIFGSWPPIGSTWVSVVAEGVRFSRCASLWLIRLCSRPERTRASALRWIGRSSLTMHLTTPSWLIDCRC